MGKLVKPLTAVTGFVPARPKATRIALDPTLSKATGAVIRTLQITCHAANGSAAEANQ